MREPDVPAALRWLVAAVLLAGAAWALVVPAWQVPDEDAHFAYVQTVAELGRLPHDDGRPAKSTEQSLAERASGFRDSAQRIEARPAWSAAAEARWRARDAALPASARADGGGANPADANPPGYYLYAAVPYLVARSGDVLDRLYLMRLWSVPLLALFAVSGWLLAGELLGRPRAASCAGDERGVAAGVERGVAAGAERGVAAGAERGVAAGAERGVAAGAERGVAAGAERGVAAGAERGTAPGVRSRPDRRAQLLAGAVCGLAPMASFVSAAVTPDALLFPLWGLALWLCARVAVRGPRPARRDVVALLLVTAGALAVKPVSVALLPGVVYALAWRRIPVKAVVAAGLLGCAAAVVLVPGGPRRFASYLWQFYSPVQAGAADIPQLQPWPLRDVWLEGTAGAFGWLEVRFPWPVYALTAVLIVVTVVVAARRVRPRRDAPVLMTLALPALALLAGLHLTEATFLVRADDAFTQGRYLLPLLPLAGLAAAGALRALPPARRGVALGAALGLLAAAQLASLALVAARFYA